MEVKYNLDKRDIWRMNKLQFIYHPTLRYGLILYLLIVLYFIVLALINHGSTGVGQSIVLLLFFILIYYLTKWIVIRKPTTNSDVLGEHIIVIEGNGLLEKTKVDESIYEWKNFLRIKQNREYILLYFKNNSVHIIPKSVFSDNKSAETFCSHAIDLWKIGKG